jgi:hypothetical protein
VAIEAGRITLKRLGDLERQGVSFALDSTLASQALARRLSRLRRVGYQVNIVYLWLPTADLAIARVAERVRRADTTCRPTWCGAASRGAGATSSRCTVRWRTDGASTMRHLFEGHGSLRSAAGRFGRSCTTGPRGGRRPGSRATSDRKLTLDELFADGRAIDEALEEAARDARRFHKALGNPMATWADGRVVWVQPDDIVVDDEPGEGRETPS